MSNPHNITVGQELYVVSHLYWRARENVGGSLIRVTKVGRKWAYLANHDRVDLETMCLDGRGFFSPGRCYLSEQHYEQVKATTKHWVRFKLALDRSVMSPNLTIEDIDHAASIIGLAIGK